MVYIRGNGAVNELTPECEREEAKSALDDIKKFLTESDSVVLGINGMNITY